MARTGGADRELGGLAALMESLRALPRPDQLVDALLAGPGAAVGATGAIVCLRDVDGLRALGAAGVTLAETHRALALAMREIETVLVPAGSGGRRSRPRSLHVAVPVVWAGAAVGAYALACPPSREFTPDDLDLLAGAASAIALWLAIPGTGLVSPADDPPPTAVRLTDRQRAVLAQAAAGRSTPAIAASLGYSESTVKQELRRIGQALGANGRTATLRRAEDFGLLEEDA